MARWKINFSKFKFNQKSLSAINIVLGQTLFVLLAGFYGYLIANSITIYSPLVQRYASFIFLGIGVTLTTGTIILIREINRMAEKEMIGQAQALQTEKAEEMIRVLRTHRHDFLNHLQVISGFAQLKKPAEVLRYISTVTEEMKLTGRITTITKPEVAALLLSEFNNAESLSIKIEADIRSNLSGLMVKSYDLVRIIGNLLDNAIYALTQAPLPERKLGFSLLETASSYQIIVFNGGSFIPEELREKIFGSNFTTRNEEGSGLGLYIVHSLVKKYGGTIEVRSCPKKGTTFIVEFPRKLETGLKC